MTIHSLIETIFRDLIVDGTKIPIFRSKALGEVPSTYLVYYVSSEKPAAFSDDLFTVSTYYLTIDIFSAGNYKKLKKEVLRVMLENHFTWVGNGPEDYESETGLFHLPMDFFYMKGSE